MSKKNDKKNELSYIRKKHYQIEYGFIILTLVVIYVLLMITLNYQYQRNDTSFDFNNSFNRNLVLFLIFSLLIVTTLFILSLRSSIFSVKGNAKDVGVNFSQIKENKTKIKTDEFLYDALSHSGYRKHKFYEAISFEEDKKEKKNEEIKDSDSRFYMLTKIDEEMLSYKEPIYNDSISLEELCNEFRNYASYKLHLYYDIKDIRRFIAGLAVTKIIILQGMSGTGKTSLAYAFGEFINNKTVVVPIQPMWKERTDLIGYYNEFTKKFNETTLLYKMYEACYTNEIYITVLDEMNIARVEYYFAEFLSLFELPNPEGRNLDVVSDVWDNDPKLLRDGKLRLPINMWFIGTANNDDSTFSISDKVYDRAMVLNLDKKALPFEAKPCKEEKISVDYLYELFIKAREKNKLSNRNYRRLKMLDKYLIDTFQITFGNRIMKQIEAYVPIIVECGGTELDALDDIISRKILRKLESKNPVYVRSQSEALINTINDIFGDNKLPLSIDFITHIEQN